MLSVKESFSFSKEISGIFTLTPICPISFGFNETSSFFEDAKTYNTETGQDEDQ